MRLFDEFVLLVSQLVFRAQTTGDDTPVAGQASEQSSLLDTVLGYANWLIAIVVAIIIIVALKKILTGGDGRKLSANIDRTTRKAISAKLKSGDVVGAGDVAYQSGAYEQAAELYLEGDHFALAAEAYAAGNKRSQAIQNFKRAKLPLRAAELYEKGGQFRAAANEYVACNDMEKAARLFFKAKDFRRAGEVFEKLRRFVDAGEAYERLGAKQDAAEMYERYFKEEYEIARGNLDAIPKAVEKAQYAATYYKNSGILQRASSLFERSGDMRSAAKLLAESGKIDEAASLFMKANKPELAAKLYVKAGKKVKAAACRGEALLQRQNFQAAAVEFARGKEYLKSATAFLEGGMRRQAAEMFAKSKDFRQAAELFTLEDDLELAAKCFEKAGDHSRAAGIYQRLGDAKSELRALSQARDYFRMGTVLIQVQRFEEALHALQKVDANNEKYLESCELQGDILRKMGRHDVAYGKYRMGTGETEPNANSLPLFYKMALCAEELKEEMTALEIYERVLAVDFYFEDVQDRVQGLQARLGRSASLRTTGRPSTRGTGPQLHRSTGMQASLSAMNVSSAGANAPMRYEIVDEIARGGMGVVYRARDTVLGRTVAFKILSDNLKGNQTAVEYFLREARAAAALQHPNIVTVFDAGEQGGEFYMAMEYVDGKTLKELIAEQGLFHEKLVRFILHSSAKALAYAHKEGIVHRDIKSGNMMIARDKTLKIMDFGLAKFLKEYQSQHTKAIGTPFYMSPEQILGHDLDHRSDLYSLGVTLFECATGTVPFYKGEMAYHHLHTPPPSPLSLNPKLSEKMNQIILKLLEKSPDDRYQSAEDVAKALKSSRVTNARA